MTSFAPLAHAMAASRNFLRADEVDAIVDLTLALPDRHVVVVDIGAGAGTTALAVLETRNVNITVFTIDISHENLDWARMALRNAGLSNSWVSVYSPSARRFLDHVDLLLVDGDHTFEGVTADLDAWLPAVAWRGPVWLDDYSDDYPGVRHAVLRAPLNIERELSKSVVCTRA